jgi:hypothetical protein
MTAQTKPTSRHRFLMDETGNKTELELAITALCTWWIRNAHKNRWASPSYKISCASNLNFSGLEFGFD